MRQTYRFEGYLTRSKLDLYLPQMRWIKSVLLVFLLLACAAGFFAYQLIYRENTAQTENRPLKIPEGSNWEDVLRIMENDSLVKNPVSLDRLAKWSGYAERIKVGYYRIKPGMNNKEILRLLASGRQEEVKLVIRSSWDKQKLIGYVCQEITADSMFMLNLLNDSTRLQKLGWTSDNILAAFIPNTYNFYWTTSADEFLNRMLKEHDRFWTESRRAKAKALNLTPIEVSILASIVEKETAKADEMPTVAGVYLNRLKKGMKLEADPTVIFAIGNPEIRRVTSAMLQYESPFNTYFVTGLPPGPICMPSIQAIDAVLKNEKHDYIYFCAKEDFSGYHNFTSSYNQHLINARKYRLELNKRGIR